MRHVFVVLTVVLWSAFVHAQTYYVDDGGSPQSCAAMQTITTPTNTIQSAVNCLGLSSGNATISIRTGLYNEVVTLFNKAGTSGNPLTIQGHPGDARPVIRPTSASTHVFNTDSTDWLDAYTILKGFDIDGINQDPDLDCLAINTNHMEIDNLHLMNCARNGLKLFSSFNHVHHTTITNCGRNPIMTVDTKGLGIYINYTNNLVEHTVIDGCRAGGVVVQFNAPTDTILRYNIVKNCGMYSPWPPPGGFTLQSCLGLGTADDSTGTKIYNNILIRGSCDPAGSCNPLSNEGSPCIYVTGNASNFEIYNNTCVDWTVGGMFGACGTYGTGAFRNNILATISHSNVICGTAGTVSHNLQNPSLATTFLNAGTDDYRLKAGSAAINTGVAVSGVVTDDFLGVLRPQPPGGVYDIGAYEFEAGGGAPAPTLIRVIR